MHVVCFPVDMLEQDLFGDIQSSSQTMSFHFKVRICQSYVYVVLMCGRRKFLEGILTCVQ